MEVTRVVAQADLEQSPQTGEYKTFSIKFPQSQVKIQQIRVVRGTTVAHQGLKESITQRGEEIERLEVFATDQKSPKGFSLVVCSTKLVEKNSSDTIFYFEGENTVGTF